MEFFPSSGSAPTHPCSVISIITASGPLYFSSKSWWSPPQDDRTDTPRQLLSACGASHPGLDPKPKVMQPENRTQTIVPIRRFLGFETEHRQVDGAVA